MPCFFIIFLGVLLVSPVVRAAEKGAEPFALIELFTSEGCSSCPPADILLSKLAASAQQQGLHIYPISLHVDYWNRLGWRDPFSQKQFTQRQQDYAQFFNADGVATPQFVINGSRYVLSADSQKLQRLVNQALSEEVSAVLGLSLHTVTENKLRVAFVYEGDLIDKLVHVVLIERTVDMDVASGENAGRKLRHNNVARQWQTLNLAEARGEVDLNFTHVKPWEDFFVIAFVQDAQSMEILAASAIDIRG